MAKTYTEDFVFESPCEKPVTSNFKQMSTTQKHFSSVQISSPWEIKKVLADCHDLKEKNCTHLCKHLFVPIAVTADYSFISQTDILQPLRIPFLCFNDNESMCLHSQNEYSLLTVAALFSSMTLLRTGLTLRTGVSGLHLLLSDLRQFLKLELTHRKKTVVSLEISKHNCSYLKHK